MSVPQWHDRRKVCWRPNGAINTCRRPNGAIDIRRERDDEEDVARGAVVWSPIWNMSSPSNRADRTRNCARCGTSRTSQGRRYGHPQEHWGNDTWRAKLPPEICAVEPSRLKGYEERRLTPQRLSPRRMRLSGAKRQSRLALTGSIPQSGREVG